MKKLEDRRFLLGIAVAAAVLVGTALVAGSWIAAGSETDTAKPAPPAATQRPASEQRSFAGIRQQGAVLGNAQAQLTLVEFADLQCPFCAQWARQTLPVVVDRYVRAGKLRIVFQGLTFLGPDSVRAARTAVAAGRQGRLWDVVHTLYEVQGAENSGWVTDELLGDVVEGAGLDYDRVAADRELPAVDDEVAKAQAAATAAGVTSVPAFALGRTGKTLTLLRVSSLALDGIIPAIEEQLPH